MYIDMCTSHRHARRIGVWAYMGIYGRYMGIPLGICICKQKHSADKAIKKAEMLFTAMRGLTSSTQVYRRLRCSTQP